MHKLPEDFTHTSEHNFNTESMYVMIENLTESRSAFGVTDEGEAVFFNARIAKLLNFDQGDLVEGIIYLGVVFERPWLSKLIPTQ